MVQHAQWIGKRTSAIAIQIRRHGHAVLPHTEMVRVSDGRVIGDLGEAAGSIVEEQIVVPVPVVHIDVYVFVSIEVGRCCVRGRSGSGDDRAARDLSEAARLVVEKKHIGSTIIRYEQIRGTV